MKKKKQKHIPSSAAAAGGIDFTDAELKSAIRSHAEFFDQLIELIPARFYLPKDDDDSKPWYPGLSKAAKASLKVQSKQNLNLARRQRLDPDCKPSSSTLHLLQQQQITKTPLSDGSDFVNLEEDGESQDKPIDSEEKSATYEVLRQKLRKKIELLRGNRGEKKAEDVKVRNDAKKRKRDGENDGKEVALDENDDDDDDDDDDDEEIVEYGKVRLEDDEERKNNKKNKKKKLSKAKELEKAKRLQEVKKEKPGIAERESWKAAESRAMGVKVHDDPRLIKESMKREKRKRDKNAEKWKERVETQEKMKGERQKKRKENIVGRIKEKKMRKIAKREKKLMRPGFEGRKEGFITQD